MAPSTKTDKFAQIGYLEVTESAANTLTMASLSVFSNILSQKGMLIHRAEYNVSSGNMALLAASEDMIQFGLAGDDSMATVSLTDPEVYDFTSLQRLDFGTAASGNIFKSPVIKDFSDLPGGGKLIPADRMYLFAKGYSLGDVLTIGVRFHFTIINLSAQDYLELAQAMRVLK